MDIVPYSQPLAGREPQYVPWGVLLVRPSGHPRRRVPPRTADQRSRAYHTLLRVLRWGRYGHREGAKTPEVGSLACVSRGPLSSRPPFRCVVCGGGFPLSPRWGGGGGRAAPRLSWPCCLCACPHLPWLWFAAGGGGWSPATTGCGSGSWVWLPCRSWLGSSGVAWGVGLRHSSLRSAGLRGVAPRFRLWVLGGRSLATPG